MRIDIYTDGACKGNPGPGGCAAILVCGERRLELHGGEERTTNGRMEVLAVLKGLLAVKGTGHDITIISDSQYVVKGITEWLDGWRARNWRNAAKKPVQHSDLWEQIYELKKKHNVSAKWVEAHAGNILNERADYLASEQAYLHSPSID